jgi:hypothetical protein
MIFVDFICLSILTINFLPLTLHKLLEKLMEDC